MKPFRQLRFADLPRRPPHPHPFFELEPRDLEVRSRAFGRVRVRYRELGEGEPLLLVHGLMTSSYSWRYVLEPLSRHHRLLVPDLVGCGDSDKPDTRYPVRGLAEFVVELMEALDIRGADVVGNSLGGYITMWSALDHPGAIRRLVNIHSPGVPLKRLFALRTAMAIPGSERLLDALVAIHPERWAHNHVHYWHESLKSREETREYGRPLTTLAGRRAFARYLSDTLDPRDMERFVVTLERSPFPIPLRLLYARRDPMVPPVVGERLARLVPAAELVWLDECSHFAHVDQPELLARSITSWLDETAPERCA